MQLTSILVLALSSVAIAQSSSSSSTVSSAADSSSSSFATGPPSGGVTDTVITTTSTGTINDATRTPSDGITTPANLGNGGGQPGATESADNFSTHTSSGFGARVTGMGAAVFAVGIALL